MSTHIDYTQIAAKLDYAAVEKKLEQLAQREPPRKRKTAVDVLEPLRERLLALHRKGWSSAQLVDELKAVGIPVSPARLRDCLAAGRTTATEPGNDTHAAGTNALAATAGCPRPRARPDGARAHPVTANRRSNCPDIDRPIVPPH